jgi:hypothetical protein
LTHPWFAVSRSTATQGDINLAGGIAARIEYLAGTNPIWNEAEARNRLNITYVSG